MRLGWGTNIHVRLASVAADIGFMTLEEGGKKMTARSVVSIDVRVSLYKYIFWAWYLLQKECNRGANILMIAVRFLEGRREVDRHYLTRKRKLYLSTIC